jgi:MerR family transcriptional regulator/heat shock protein HspR
MSMTKTPDFYLISMAAELVDMHPQTLRKYERLGLVRPHRTSGSMRVYTRAELDRLRLIKTFVDEAGINLAGVERLLSVAEIALRLRPLVRGDGRPPRRAASDRRLAAEVEALCRLLGLDRVREER